MKRFGFFKGSDNEKNQKVLIFCMPQKTLINVQFLVDKCFPKDYTKQAVSYGRQTIIKKVKICA
jgi:hypothetical protein